MQYHNTLDALVYYQTGAECEALYRQSFALARLSLEQEMKRALAHGVPPEHLHLISDCDETLLDNSEFNVWTLETGRDFHQSNWSKWCQARRAKATPGALEFLHFADMNGVQVYYVTGRVEADREATAANLRELGFPLPDSSDDAAKTRLFMEKMTIEGAETKKLQQFAYLQKKLGEPLLRLGDSLSDHDPARYGRPARAEERVLRVREDAANLGMRWIVFPNPIYGAWRESLSVMSGKTELPVKDEPVPPPYQAEPVRPTVTPSEAPKVGLLRRW